MIRKLAVILMTALMCMSHVMAHQAMPAYMKNVSEKARLRIGSPTTKAKHFRTVEVSLDLLRKHLKNVTRESDESLGPDITISLPLPDGSMEDYRVVENNTMHPKLAAKFPSIKSYNAYGIKNPSEYVKFSVTPLGLHAMILRPGKSPVFIDPYSRSNIKDYIVYQQKDFQTDKVFSCGVTNHSKALHNTPKIAGTFSTCELRTYRLAVAATGEYTTHFGGKAGAIAAITNTINRVDGIYEQEAAISFTLVANNDDIVYTDGATDPYPSGDIFALVDENQLNLDAVIGTNNYDIGHVFDISNGGYAPGLTCNSFIKAKGATGSPNPTGDPFDVDYVAHEIGHQLSANHVQNNACGRWDPTAVEPGSGSTIMGYAGICPQNIQSNSDAYFNAISLQEIGVYKGGGGACGSVTAITNAPTLTMPTSVVIPANTPFLLNTSASGTFSNQFSYTAEQQDATPSAQPPLPTNTDGPNFRSVLPSLNTTRYLPNLFDLSTSATPTWEVIPSVSRTMSFRLTVRNNEPGGSCNAYEDMTVTTDILAGPFIVTSVITEWPAESQQTITWDVAGTNQSPFSADKVRVSLSTDGGQTFAPYFAEGDNTGSMQITVPNIPTSTARIKVEGHMTGLLNSNQSGATFFNINSNDFTITPAASSVAPALGTSTRNPLNLNTAFIYYDSLGDFSVSDTFVLNGVAGASFSLDATHSRFVISGISDAHAITNVTITAQGTGKPDATTSAVTIPSIL